MPSGACPTCRSLSFLWNPVEELYAEASATYGADRVSEQSFLNAVQRCLAEAHFGYAATETSIIQTGPEAVALEGYVGRPEPLPADTRIVRLSGPISSVEPANVMKAAISLSRLGESTITVDLRLELKGEVSDHSVTIALNELKSHVASLSVDDSKPS